MFWTQWKSSPSSISYPRLGTKPSVPRAFRFHSPRHLHPSPHLAGVAHSRMEAAVPARHISQEVGTTSRLGRHACASTTRGSSPFTILLCRALSNHATERIDYTFVWKGSRYQTPSEYVPSVMPCSCASKTEGVASLGAASHESSQSAMLVASSICVSCSRRTRRLQTHSSELP